MAPALLNRAWTAYCGRCPAALRRCRRMAWAQGAGPPLVGGKAARHFQRELEGARLLALQGLTTGAAGRRAAAGRGRLVVKPDHTDAAQSSSVTPGGGGGTGAAGRCPASGARRKPRAAIGELHAKGPWQDDLHPPVACYAGRLYLIDGGGVRAEIPAAAVATESAGNLGVFFAQLPALLDPFLEELLVHYLLANGEHALPLEALQKEIAKVRRWRVRDSAEEGRSRL